MSRAAAVLAALLAAAGCRARPPEVLYELPDFSLQAVEPASLRPFGLADLKGRVWVADFIFTRCSGPCPVLTSRLAGLLPDLPPEAGLLTVSVDPRGDTPERLREYARRRGADPARWTFLRGGVEETYRALFAVFRLPMSTQPREPEDRRVIHSTRFLLIDRAGRARGLYDGLSDADRARLLRDARVISKEAP